MTRKEALPIFWIMFPKRRFGFSHFTYYEKQGVFRPLSKKRDRITLKDLMPIAIVLSLKEIGVPLYATKKFARFVASTFELRPHDRTSYDSLSLSSSVEIKIKTDLIWSQLLEAYRELKGVDYYEKNKANNVVAIANAKHRQRRAV